MSSEAIRPRGRPAHTPGTTILTYTPDGRRVVTAGSNSAIRIYTSGQDGEPTTTDEGVEGHFGIAATNEWFFMGAEDGTVWQYGLSSGKMEKLLVRVKLPVRDIAVSRDGEWVAVASDELTVKIVNIEDMTRVKYLREQTKGSKHVSFDPTGQYVTVSCTDGILYVYSLASDEPELVRKLDGVIRRLEPEDEASSRAVWHPDALSFASAQVTRDIVIFASADWSRHKSFSNGHHGEITCLAWSPNGALLVSAGADGQILLWETNTQNVLRRYDFTNVINIAWHPSANTVSFTTSDGELFIHDDFVPREHQQLLNNNILASSPLLGGSLVEISGNAQKPLANHRKPNDQGAVTPDELDDILGSIGDEDNFVEDDDGAGYAEAVNGFGKRTNGHLDVLDGHDQKRLAPYWQPKQQLPFQPGSTSWRGLNLTGAIWTVDQETHNTVTVDFYDSELHRNFHFTDPYRYDKACLNESGALFASAPSDDIPAMIYYRPHETWTTRADWRTQLPPNETVRAIALSDSYVVVSTSANYVRVYTLFGTPYRIYRQKSPSVTCVAWRDYILTIGTGPMGVSGSLTLTYSIENVKRDEICQNEDIVAISAGSDLKSVFFSDNGDPCIYDSEGILLVLQHWRSTGQARWVPLLDTKLLDRLAQGRKEESYWPVAVAQNKFHCIILKGGDTEPYFPRPLLSEFDFKIPISITPPKDRDTDDEQSATANDNSRFEEAFVRETLMLSLLEDLVTSTNATRDQRAEVVRKEVEVDKILLQMLAVDCREGEERGMKALELVELMKDRSGKMLEAAVKVAQRYDRSVLEEKIQELGERRLMGMDDDDELA